MLAPKPSGFTSTKEGKAKSLARARQLVDQSGFIIIVPIEGVSKENIDLLRKDLPKGTVASVVKNSLMRVVIKDTPFAALKPALKQENMYFFIPEGSQKDVLEVYKKWQKEAKRAEPEFDAKAGVLEGVLYTGEGLESAVKMPSRKELITSIAIAIKAVPTKLARTVKAVPAKVGKAINLVKEKQAKEAAGDSA